MIPRNSLMILAQALMLTGCSPETPVDVVVGELASDRVELAAESVEPIIALQVDEGQAVDAGQVLVEQDPARARTRVADAQAALDQARARLAELVRGPRSEQIEAARASLAGAADELDFREAEFERIRRVTEQGLAPPDLLDQAKAALDAARANVRARKARLDELLTGTTVEEITQAEAAVGRAEAALDLTRIDLDRLTIRAPAAGVVDSRLFEVGERPAPGQPVLVMLAGQQPYARVYIPEPIRARVRPGTRAEIHVDGFEQPVSGRVRWVSSEAAFTPYFALTERDRGRLTYEAKVDLETDRERLPDGVPVQVDLALERTL